MNIICSSSPLVPFNLSVSSPFRLLRSLLPAKIVQPLRCHHFTLALFTPSLPLLKFYCSRPPLQGDQAVEAHAARTPARPYSEPESEGEGLSIVP